MESHQGLWGPYTLFPCWVFQWSQAFLCLRRTPPSPLKVSGGIVKCEVFVHSMLPTGRVCGHSLCSRQQGRLLGSHRYPQCLQCLSRRGDDNTQTRLSDWHGATHCPFSGGSGAPPLEPGQRLWESLSGWKSSFADDGSDCRKEWPRSGEAGGPSRWEGNVLYSQDALLQDEG